MPYKLEVTLQQQTPMIHFQHYEPGATIRGSELKPKLDRFLIERLGGPKAMMMDPERREFFIDDSNFNAAKKKLEEDPKAEITQHLALDYKVRIRAVGEQEVKGRRTRETRAKARDVDINASFFGNIGADDGILEQYRRTVRHQSVSLSVFCFNGDLLGAIQDNIRLFFWLRNFGTRQSKGFGSFSVIKIGGHTVESVDVGAQLKQYYSDQNIKLPVFELKFVDNQRYHAPARLRQDPLEWIRVIYGFMKSGFNLPIRGSKEREYFKGFSLMYPGNQFGNDKAFVKQMIGQVTRRDARFIRAMLGTSDHVEWARFGGRPRGDVSYKHLSDAPEAIDRVPSPILFSVTDGGRVFLLPSRLPRVLFGQTFRIDWKEEGGAHRHEHGIIKTPSRTEFVFEDFLKNFAARFNDAHDDLPSGSKNSEAIAWCKDRDRPDNDNDIYMSSIGPDSSINAAYYLSLEQL